MKSNKGQAAEIPETDGLQARTDVANLAARVLGTRELADHWLTHPALALDGQSPMDLLGTTSGVKSVKDLLTRMEFGVYT